jgi:hypothetical protein
VLDHYVVQHAGPQRGVPRGPLDDVVLEVRILGADRPTILVARLKHVGRHADAHAVVDGGPHGDVRAIEQELVEVFARAAEVVLVVAEDEAGDVHGGCRRLGRRLTGELAATRGRERDERERDVHPVTDTIPRC